LEKEESTINLQRTKQQRKMNRNTARETVSSAHILIICYSHSMSLAAKIRNYLDDSFKIYGLTKPNTDIQQITSQLNMEHLTKEDIVIFLGGTNDISKNESKKGCVP
jgi:alcohol dehydrogenase class IV